MYEFHSHGKLLITGEYVVLDGATALAVPTIFGQALTVKELTEPVIKWKSIDNNGIDWFEDTFTIEDIRNPYKTYSGSEIGRKLFSLLQYAAQVNPAHLAGDTGYEISASVDFPLNWGLGSSSTLVANIAKWFNADPYYLLQRTFGGSGYDIGVAMEGCPITYQLNKNGRSVLSTSFDPAFKDQLFFIHLNQKQNSRDSIQYYRNQNKENLSRAVDKISSLSYQMINCSTLSEFELLLDIHENIISQLINLPKVKAHSFPDYPRTIKSLGGWGGDFLLATGGEDERNYFRRKGYCTILSYSEMVL